MCSFKLLQGGELKNHSLRCLKYNTDKCSKENLGLSALAFCIRNTEGDMVYAEVQKIVEVSAIAAERKAVKQGMDDCVQMGCLALTIETDSLITKEILDLVWEVIYTFKEGNKLVVLLN